MEKFDLVNYTMNPPILNDRYLTWEVHYLDGTHLRETNEYGHFVHRYDANLKRDGIKEVRLCKTGDIECKPVAIMKFPDEYALFLWRVRTHPRAFKDGEIVRKVFIAGHRHNINGHVLENFLYLSYIPTQHRSAPWLFESSLMSDREDFFLGYIPRRSSHVCCLINVEAQLHAVSTIENNPISNHLHSDFYVQELIPSRQWVIIPANGNSVLFAKDAGDNQLGIYQSNLAYWAEELFPFELDNLEMRCRMNDSPLSN